MTDIIKAFLTGGLICSLVQILLDRTKLMPGRVMVMLVVSGGILGWLPLAGSMCIAIESMAEDGFLGIFRGGLTAASAGITGALVFGYLGALVFKPKMK